MKGGVKKSTASAISAPSAVNPIGRRWKRADYSTDAVILARKLLGCVLVRVLDDGMILAGRIVETEAYCGVIDAASHAYRGRRTARNEAMYSRPGTAYVYFTYGMHYCMNVVCGAEGDPLAVLIRALEPITGLDRMRELRAIHPGKSKRTIRVPSDRELCSGPARLCQAMAIGREQNGLDLVVGRRLYVAEPSARSGLPPVRPKDIARTPRIGIGYAGEWAGKPLRFVVTTSPHISKSVAGRSAATPNAKMAKIDKPSKAPGTTGKRTPSGSPSAPRN